MHASLCWCLHNARSHITPPLKAQLQVGPTADVAFVCLVDCLWVTLATSWTPRRHFTEPNHFSLICMAVIILKCLGTFVDLSAGN